MFWYLFFAHLVADFPLQTYWMAVNKHRIGVLFLHVVIHLLVSFVIISLVAFELRPFVVALAIIHFLIDYGKTYISKLRPNWVIASYFVDQLLHISSIVLISVLIAGRTGLPPFALEPIWLILMIAYLMITYVWYISERIIGTIDSDYFKQVVDKAWSRMLARTLFLTLMLVSLISVSSVNLAFASLVRFPYRAESFGYRALLIDLLISSGGAVFIILVI